MKKLVAITCVVAWTGFWAFGYLALSANIDDAGQVLTAAVLAGLGFLTGTYTYLKLCRDCD
jgi:hypothetical protein